MAKRPNFNLTADSGDALPHASDYRSMPAGTRRLVPDSELDFFPGNVGLVGALPEKQKALLREDILANGIREAIQVWPVDGKLLVVSGNERLAIVRALPEGKRPGGLPCEIRHFPGWAEARNHVITVNENRKTVKLPPPDRLVRVFPPEEFPWIFADLRTRAEEIQVLKIPGGIFKTERPLRAEVARAEQAESRARAAAILGWSDAFLKKTISAVWSKSGRTQVASRPPSPTGAKIVAGVGRSILSRVEKNPEIREAMVKELKSIIKRLANGNA